MYLSVCLSVLGVVLALAALVAEFGFAPEGYCPQRSIVTPDDLAAQRMAQSRRDTHRIGVVVLGVPSLVGLVLVGVELHARRRSKGTIP